MNRKVYCFLLVVAMASGFVGGTVAGRLSNPEAVFAHQETQVGTVIEAQEFRLLDKNGKSVARLTVEGGGILAEIPDFSGWTIRFLKKTPTKE